MYWIHFNWTVFTKKPNGLFALPIRLEFLLLPPPKEPLLTNWVIRMFFILHCETFSFAFKQHSNSDKRRIHVFFYSKRLLSIDYKNVEALNLSTRKLICAGAEISFFALWCRCDIFGIIYFSNGPREGKLSKSWCLLDDGLNTL